MAIERVKQITSHLTGRASGVAALQQKRPDDVVITMAIRTPLCRAQKGGFKDLHSDELMFEMYKAVVARCGIDPALVEDIVIGNVLSKNAAYQARAAAIAAGFSEKTPTELVNRFCSSGLMAITAISNKIRAGQIDIGLAVGSESMSQDRDRGATPFSEEIAACQAAKDCEMPMGWTSENVASDFDISREEMDELAALSFQRAEGAQKSGLFDQEIVPIDAWTKESGDSSVRTKKLVSKDDGIRPGTTAQGLGKIRSAFPQWGKGYTTGGNASQVTDGAAAVLLMTRRKAEELGLKILAKHVTTSVSGLPPRIMGIGPTFAIPQVLQKAGISQDDVDLWEVNEAFASMYVYCVKKLGLDIDKVNVKGGAIALGHPLGTTGTRQVATALPELERRGGKVLVTSMCIGTGMGAAAVFVRD